MPIFSASKDWTAIRERIASALAVALIHGALGYLFLLGLGVDLPRRPERALALFDLTVPPRRQVEPPPEPVRSAEPKGRAARSALRAAPKPVVAPPPPAPLPLLPVIAAPVAGQGEQADAGAAPTPGPGTGAYGTGDGLGAGGDGGGTGRSLARPARRVAGELRNADYPRAAVRARAGGDVVVRLLIDAGGRVAGCDVSRSSGNADLDSVTCRLIRERFRYEPALDAQGRPVSDRLGWRQSWWLER